MEVFWCVQDTAIFLICLHKSAWLSHQDEVNLHVWSGLPCSFGSGECLVPTDSLSMSLFLLLSQPPHRGREDLSCDWSRRLLQEDQSIAKPVFKTRNPKKPRKTDYFSFILNLHILLAISFLFHCYFNSLHQKWTLPLSLRIVAFKV